MSNEDNSNLNNNTLNKSTNIDELTNLFSKLNISDQKSNCNSVLLNSSTSNSTFSLTQFDPEEQELSIKNSFDECLFVGNLGDTYSRVKLNVMIYNYFNKEYKVEHVSIFENKYNYSVAFVYFSDSGTVDSILSCGNSLIIDGKLVRIDSANKNNLLFISNIEPGITNQQFWHQLNRFG